jgi:hypothetical protein
VQGLTSDTGQQYPHIRMKILFVTVIIIVTGLCIWFALPAAGYIQEAELAAKNIKSAIGESRLRAWATNIVEKYRSKIDKIGTVEFPKSEIPNWLTNLSPFPLHDGSIIIQPHGKEYVAVGWYSGQGGMVLHVGSTNFVEVEQYPGLYQIKCADGIYVLTDDGNR